MIKKLWKTITSNDKLHVAYCVVGIVGCLMLYGVLQERIMAEPFGEEKKYFKITIFLVFLNRVVTTLVSLFALIIFKLDLKPVAPVYSYMAVSFSNVIATTCQYEALKYVSFPVQTLGKCAKMIPVMIWGAIISRKKYTINDYLVAIIVTVGCTMFLLTGEINSKAASNINDPNADMYGLFLMLGYLGFDGFTSNFQDNLFKGYKMSMFNQAFYVQLTAACQSLFVLISTDLLIPSIAFIIVYPRALMYMLSLSLAATVGQLFIYHTIKSFGALLFATVMTTRQFLSILLSCIIFIHPLSLGQWAGTVMVFGALYFKAFMKKSHSSSSSTNGEKSTNEKNYISDEKLPLTHKDEKYENLEYVEKK